MTHPNRPLPALLSQVLVAFTVELDSEFESRMTAAGYPAILSAVVWLNLMRFITESGTSISTLAAEALTTQQRVKLQAGCLERWRLVVIAEGKRQGWGSGRGLRANSMLRLTAMGGKACEIWRPLFGEMERQWNLRFGADQIRQLRHSLEDLAAGFEIELPLGFPAAWPMKEKYPARTHRNIRELPLITLLSQVLLAFTLEFDRLSKVPLALCANTIRVLGEAEEVSESDIPRFTGASPEISGIGWQIKPFVKVARDTSKSRRRLVTLTPLGLMVFKKYGRLIEEIKGKWEVSFGESQIQELVRRLEVLFPGPAMTETLMPAAGTIRSGEPLPSLGQEAVTNAARKRMRDMVQQSKEFVKNPAMALPHHPLWDMNRGFGP